MKRTRSSIVKVEMEKPERHQWLTKREVKQITRHTSDNGLDNFVKKHRLRVRKRGNCNLYIADEVHAAMNSELITMGL